MRLRINGVEQEVPDGLNVISLLQYLGLVAERVAIERNLGILPRPDWEKTCLEPGDSLEIVHLVGGGSE